MSHKLFFIFCAARCEAVGGVIFLPSTPCSFQGSQPFASCIVPPADAFKGSLGRAVLSWHRTLSANVPSLPECPCGTASCSPRRAPDTAPCQQLCMWKMLYHIGWSNSVMWCWALWRLLRLHCVDYVCENSSAAQSKRVPNLVACMHAWCIYDLFSYWYLFGLVCSWDNLCGLFRSPTSEVTESTNPKTSINYLGTLVVPFLHIDPLPRSCTMAIFSPGMEL